MTAALLRLPASQRRLAALAVPVLALASIAGIRYFGGGPRLTGAGGGMTAPVIIDEELDVLIPLDTGGEDVTLVRTNAVGVTGTATVDVRLLRTREPVRAYFLRGSLRQAIPGMPAYDVLPLAGATVNGLGWDRSDERERLQYVLDVRLRPPDTGAHGIKALEVTYRSGFLRARTAVLSSTLCVLASAHWRPLPDQGYRACDSERPGLAAK